MPIPSRVVRVIVLVSLGNRDTDSGFVFHYLSLLAKRLRSSGFGIRHDAKSSAVGEIIQQFPTCRDAVESRTRSECDRPDDYRGRLDCCP